MNDIAHLTLTTGHLRLSPRDEIPRQVIDVLAPIAAAGGGEVHGIGIAIAERAPGWARFELSLRGEVVARCLCCWRREGADDAWREAMRLPGIGLPKVYTAPPVPWVAATLTEAIERQSPDDAMAIGDAERCVAWALIEGDR